MKPATKHKTISALRAGRTVPINTDALPKLQKALPITVRLATKTTIRDTTFITKEITP